MISLENIIINENTDEDYLFNHGYINKPVNIFGQVRTDKQFGICVPKGMAPKSLLPALNEYLKFLSDCKILLIDFYRKENVDIINDWFGGNMSEDWYETLEIYGTTIDCDINGNLSAGFSCGDNMVTDHLLVVEFNGQKIANMYFEG